MKNIPSFIYILFIGMFLTISVVFYYTFAFKQNEETLFLNETIATYIPQHVDMGMARVQEQLFLDKTGFEESVKQEVSTNYPTSNITFEYLEATNGSLKGVMITMFLDDKHYTSTYKLNEIAGGK